LTPEERIAALDAVLGALAHPARRQILLTIHFWGGSMTAGEIAKRFGHAWPTTTRHLGVLLEAGLVRQTKEGRSRRYHLMKDPLTVIPEWLAWFDKPPI
jgi:DNA-binding transcriptional ArsR family regulator